MVKIIGRLFILLLVIGVTAAAVVFMVNNGSTTLSNANSDGFNPPTGEGETVLQPGQPSGDTLPQFQGELRDHEGKGSFGGLEVIKNLVIMLGITAITVLIEKILARFKKSRKVPAVST